MGDSDVWQGRRDGDGGQVQEQVFAEVRTSQASSAADCGVGWRAAVGWRMHDRGGAVGSFHISAHAGFGVPSGMGRARDDKEGALADNAAWGKRAGALLAAHRRPLSDLDGHLEPRAAGDIHSVTDASCRGRPRAASPFIELSRHATAPSSAPVCYPRFCAARVSRLARV